MNIEEVQKATIAVQTTEEPLMNIKDFEIDELENEEWSNIDDTLERMQKLIETVPKPTYIYQQPENDDLTGNIEEDFKKIDSQIQENYMFYEIPVEMEPFKSSLQHIKDYVDIEIQCLEEDQPIYEIPVDLGIYKPELKLDSKITEVTIPPKIKGIHLSSSIESVIYEYKNDNDNINQVNPITPISNVAVAGWEHPQLDFYGSSEIVEKSQNLDSLMNSEMMPLHRESIKESLNFKESRIHNKIDSSVKADVNSIVETLNIKTNHPIYVIASESSSEGSQTDRQMYLSEMREKPDLKLNIKEAGQKMSDEEERVEQSKLDCLKEKIYSLEEEREELMEQLKLSEAEVFTLKEEICVQREALMFMKSGTEEEESDFQNVMENMNKLEDSRRKSQQKIIFLEEDNSKLAKELESVQLKLKDQEDFIEKMNESFSELENEFFKEIEKMNMEINEKEQAMREMQKQMNDHERYHKNEINEFMKTNEELRNVNEDLSKEIYEKKVIIQELKYHQDQLINEMESSCSQKNELDQIKTLYSKQYEKMKEDFSEMLNSKEEQIKNIMYENQRLSEKLGQTSQKFIHSEKALSEHQGVIEDLRQQLEMHQKQLKDSKYTIAAHVEAELDYLRRQLVFLTKEVDFRDTKIKQLNFELRERTPKESQSSSKLSISIEGEEEQSSNREIDELKDIIQEYQKIILSHHDVIKELQEYVYEYLGDALEKEVEVESLYQNLLNYESDMNEIVLEKISVDRENKKLKRMIEKSERKISAIGNRLIYVAKDKLQEETACEKLGEGKNYKNMKSQNSTIKMGTQSNLIH